MKKKILLGACAALFLGAGITTAIHVTRVANRASAMMLENVEALAESELERCPNLAIRYCGSWNLMFRCTSDTTSESCSQSYLNKCPC